MADAAPKRASGGKKGKKKVRRGGASENVKVVVRLRPLFEGEGGTVPTAFVSFCFFLFSASKRSHACALWPFL